METEFTASRAPVAPLGDGKAAQLPAAKPGEPAARLSLWDAVSIIIGIVIGATIFRSPPMIFGNVENPGTGLAIWALCGLLSLIGALCYAELASTYPRMGGDYVYLTRAFGPWVGFLFGWAQLAAILTASIGSMAFVFADYAVQLWGLDPDWTAPLAAAAVLALTATNFLGVVLSKWAQNLLTLAKLVGLGAIIWAGFSAPHGDAWQVTSPVGPAGLGTAMIIVLYAYGGWNDAAFVAAELRKRRNIAVALILGTTAVTLTYLVVNLAYISGLGFEGVRASTAVAADVLGRAWPGTGNQIMCVLVMVSALGAINGLIFAGSRVYAALGRDHPAFGRLGRWHPTLGSPIGALAAQAVVALLMTAAVGTDYGRGMIDKLLTYCRTETVDWGRLGGGFGAMLAVTAPPFWAFFLLTGISLFVLRQRDSGLERPFKVRFFPELPMVFCAMCVYMVYQSVVWAGRLTIFVAILVLLGVPLYRLSERLRTGRWSSE